MLEEEIAERAAENSKLLKPSYHRQKWRGTDLENLKEEDVKNVSRMSLEEQQS